MLLLFYFFRLQTGMRGAFGKPQGTVARVNIGEIIMSVRAKDSSKKAVIEALRRSKMKFPGRQKVVPPAFFVRWIVYEFYISPDSSCADICLAPLGLHSLGPRALWGAARRGPSASRRRERQVPARARPSLQLACEPVGRLILT